jgi:RHS repeat-associated protein
MLDGFGLINMNGRMYDPVIGRVLSPDIAVQAPGYTQSYNRYSYCMNNPLRYTDPSGWYVADGTSFGRDINTMIYENGATFYSFGIGSPGNYFSGTGVANTSIGAQGYRYVGGGVYMDVATGNGLDFGTVYDNSLAQEQVGFSSGSVAREFVDRIKSGFGLYSYQLYNRTNWVLSIGNPGLYAAIGGGYQTLNPTAGSFTFGGEITNVSSGGGDWINTAVNILAVGATSGYIIGFEVLRQAKLNREIAGTFSTEVKNSARIFKTIGKFTGIVGAEISWNDYFNNPTTGGLVKAWTNTGLVFIRVNPFVGIGLGILDLTGGGDWLYNQIGNGIDKVGGPGR